MADTIFSIKRIKNLSQLGTIASHYSGLKLSENGKLEHCFNKDFNDSNQDLMPMFEGKPSVFFYRIKHIHEHSGFNLKTLWNDRMCNLENYAKYTNSYSRMNRNYALEFEVSFSESALSRINEKEWIQTNINWFYKIFNIAPDGKNNIIAAILHRKMRIPHLHFLVIPVDERGRLCSSYWLSKGDEILRCVYDLSMKSLGLESDEDAINETNKLLNNSFRARRESCLLGKVEELFKSNEESYFDCNQEKRLNYMSVNECSKSESLRIMSLISKNSLKEFEREILLTSLEQEEIEKGYIESYEDIIDKIDELLGKTILINQRLLIIKNSINWEISKKARDYYRNNPTINKAFEEVEKAINEYKYDIVCRKK